MMRNPKSSLNAGFRLPRAVFRALATVRKHPLVTVLYLTYACNLGCSFCVQRRSRDRRPKPNTDDIPIEAWSRIIEELAEPCLPRSRVHLTGGEPLLAEVFPRIVRLLWQRRVPWTMTTNGTLLESHAESIVQYCARNVSVSIHGPPQVDAQTARPKGTFARIRAGLEAVRRIRAIRKTRFPRITLNCVLGGHNYQIFDTLLDHLTSLEPDSITFQHPSEVIAGAAQEEIAKAVGRFMLNVSIKRGAVPVTFFPRVRLARLTQYYADPSSRFASTCSAPWFLLRVQPNGRVTPCGDNALGNVMRSSLHDLWYSEALSHFRRRLLRSGAQWKACHRCCHRAYG